MYSLCTVTEARKLIISGENQIFFGLFCFQSEKKTKKREKYEFSISARVFK